jgi:chromosome segregation ATPase
LNLLTKILVVLGALLAVVLAALSMAFAANAATIRASVDAERSMRMAAQAELDIERTKNQGEISTRKAAQEAAQGEATRLATEINALQAERKTLLAEVRDARLNAERFRNQAAGKDQVVQTSTKLVDSLTGEVTTLRDRTIASAKREAELTERLSELEAQNQVLTQNVRALQEQLAETKSAMERAAGQVANAATPAGQSATASAMAQLASGFEASGPLVTGRVRSITRAENGEDLAFLTVGGSSGLKVGQRLSIVRDGKFVASVVLTVVDASESAGRIDRLGRSVDVMANDLVLSRVN